MLSSFPFAVTVGAALGFLAGLGVGGGSLLILWLTLVIGIAPAEARLINLMFFITAAGAVSVLRWKKGCLSIKPLIPAIIAGCAAAAITTYLRPMLQEQTVKRLFGILLLFTGLRELFYRDKNAK